MKAASLISKADQSEKDARRWKRELQLAGKREKPWRDAAEKVVSRYRGEERKKNRFNVLWSNTEILRPAIYNSRPNPDVRRRFRDADPVGKAVSEVLERSLMVMVDYECTDQSLKNDTLDGLLVGRGVSRIRYIPSLRQVGEAPKQPGEQAPPSGGKSTNDPTNQGSSGEEEQEEVEYEQVLPEHVDWADFRHGYGRVWDEVPSCFFRHKLTKPDALKKFDKADIKDVKFAAPTADDPKKPGDEVNETQKVAEFWECWDKIGQRVFFIQEDVQQLIFPIDNPDGEPPLRFSGFFPCPEPLLIIENTGSTLPIIPFHLYEQQANELDKISGRIDRITNGMRLRGIYDAKLVELGNLMEGEDNELTPVQNAQAWADKGGGLEGAISWFPTEKAAAMLQALYEARGQQKAIIDEITGIADIVRGATDPNETATAQNLKATFGSIRLQRMQKEVQRYAKDLLRLASEAMCDKFTPETFSEMTELQFPTAQQKAMMQTQVQQQQQQAMMAAQSGPAGLPPSPSQPGTAGMPAAPTAPPIDPALLKVPSWDEIMHVMRSASMRRFKIDVETDSTVAGTLNSDMTGLSQVLSAIGDVMPKLAALVQTGALPIDAAKELIMTIIRRARMGMAVEDAFDKMQAPKPPPDPNAAKAAADAQKAQVEGQVKMQVAEHQGQVDTQVTQIREQAETERQRMDQAFQAERERLDQQHQTERELLLSQVDASAKKMDAAVKIIVAMIAATKSADPEAGPIAEKEFAGVQ